MPDNTPQVVQDCHDLLLWLIPQLDKFPRLRRYTLGERIETHLLEILEWLVAAAYSRERREWLEKANQRLNVVRHLWRLSYELKAIGPKQYERGARLIDSLGRQIGGWSRTKNKQ